MAKAILILSLFTIFTMWVSVPVLPGDKLHGIIDEAYAVMGGKKIDITVKKRFSGNIGDIDQNLKMVSVVKKIGEKDFKMIFTFDSDIVVNSGADKKTTADLQSGDKVIVVYSTTDGQNVAHTIIIEK